jgi:hypothetical protein
LFICRVKSQDKYSPGSVCCSPSNLREEFLSLSVKGRGVGVERRRNMERIKQKRRENREKDEEKSEEKRGERGKDMRK